VNGATSAPQARVASERVRWWIHLLLIAAYPIVIGAAGRRRSTGQQPALGHDVKGLLINSALGLCLFAAVFGLAWLASRASRDELLLRWRQGLWTVPLGLGYSVAIRLALGMVFLIAAVVLLITNLSSPQAMQKFVLANRPDVATLVDIPALRDNPLYFWLTLTFVSFVVAGLREELWRGAFLAGLGRLWPQRFGSRAGQLGAVVVASLVFGLGHLAQGPVAVVGAAVLGLGLGLIMVLHRSIWPAAIAHGMFDATTFALLPFVLEKLPRVTRAG